MAFERCAIPMTESIKAVIERLHTATGLDKQTLLFLLILESCGPKARAAKPDTKANRAAGRAKAKKPKIKTEKAEGQTIEQEAAETETIVEQTEQPAEQAVPAEAAV